MRQGAAIQVALSEAWLSESASESGGSGFPPRIPSEEDVPRFFTAHAVVRRTFLALLGTVFAAELTSMLVIDAAMPPGVPTVVAAVVDAVLLATLAALPIWFLILQPLNGALREEHEALARHGEQLRRESAHQEFEARLHRAVEMAGSEEALRRVLQRAIDHLSPDQPMEILLVDASEAHLRREVGSVAADERFACKVESPGDCVAARRGEARLFADSAELDACPMLVEACPGGCAAACVPLSVSGRTVGVLRTVRPVEDGVGSGLLRDMQVVASQAGNQLGLIRAMDASELAASTDPLTGALNRRRLEDTLGRWLRTERTFTLVLTDIDHFKRLNDMYGHEMGDRCLRAFTQALRDSVRANDVVARIGGEEFVIAMPGVVADQALEAVERLRKALPDMMIRAGLPSVRASWGVADTLDTTDLDELLRLADKALYAAKHAGRDRVVRTTPEHGDTAVPAVPPSELEASAVPPSDVEATPARG